MYRLLDLPPLLSIVVVGYRMYRELPRTLETLSADYQRGVSGAVYEVLLIMVPILHWISLSNLLSGVKTHWLSLPSGDVSPCKAVNLGVKHARGDFVAVLVDGAECCHQVLFVIFSALVVYFQTRLFQPLVGI